MLGHKIALIPAYEPDASFVAQAQALHSAGFSLVTVDDGSGAAFASIFSAVGQLGTVLTCKDNRGKGCALISGMTLIQGQAEPGSVVVTMDADGQHTVRDAQRAARAAAEHRDALVLGCRQFDGSVPKRSRLGNQLTRFVYRVTTGSRVSDTQTGLRAFVVEHIPFLRTVPGERYEYEMNVLLACSRRGVPIVEIPIETVYFDNNAGSHFDTVRDSARIYREILKFAASSFTGFLVDYGLYSLLVVLLGGLGTQISVPLSNVLARVVSAGVNFAMNKRFVFRNKDSALSTGVSYFALAACILCGNTVLLGWLVSGLHWNKYLSKLITELTFFLLSWLVQKYVIFRTRRHEVPRSIKREVR